MQGLKKLKVEPVQARKKAELRKMGTNIPCFYPEQPVFSKF